jgi:hypothetical protein
MRTYDEDLTKLEEGLRRLKTEYHIFFNGNRKKPPDDLRFQVERIVKRLSECSNMSFSQRFRFTTLVSRFYVYRDLWRRTMTEREMGTESKRETPDAAGVSVKRDTHGEAISISISDPKSEEAKVRRLYDALVQLKKSGSQEAPLPYSQFAKYIETQTTGIREKYGCLKVAFTIALEEDSIRFTATADSR